MTRLHGLVHTSVYVKHKKRFGFPHLDIFTYIYAIYKIKGTSLVPMGKAGSSHKEL
jgi:hypothetical protein